MESPYRNASNLEVLDDAQSAGGRSVRFKGKLKGFDPVFRELEEQVKGIRNVIDMVRGLQLTRKMLKEFKSLSLTDELRERVEKCDARIGEVASEAVTVVRGATSLIGVYEDHRNTRTPIKASPMHKYKSAVDLDPESFELIGQMIDWALNATDKVLLPLNDIAAEAASIASQIQTVPEQEDSTNE